MQEIMFLTHSDPYLPFIFIYSKYQTCPSRHSGMMTGCAAVCFGSCYGCVGQHSPYCNSACGTFGSGPADIAASFARCECWTVSLGSCALVATVVAIFVSVGSECWS